MCIFMIETEKGLEKIFGRNSFEGQEAGFESREDKEEQEAKKAAVRERAEQMIKETQSAKKMMQNIIANMQQVMNAVQQIRKQLQIGDEGAIPSVARDQKIVESLKKKLMDYRSQMEDLRLALLVEEKAELKKENPSANESEIEKMAQEKVEEMMKKLV